MKFILWFSALIGLAGIGLLGPIGGAFIALFVYGILAGIASLFRNAGARL